MPNRARTRRRSVASAACALVAGALALVVGVGAGGAARGIAALVGAAQASEQPALAAPSAPVSVTYKRSFTVTSAVLGAAGDATSATVECYKLTTTGGWSLESTSRASLRATDATAPYVSAKVMLDSKGTWALRAVSGTSTASESTTSTLIRVNSTTDHIVWNHNGHLTLPERMAYRRNARQLILVTADELGSHKGKMTMYEYRDGDWVSLFSSSCRLGRNALRDGTKRHRGDGTTPTGIWRMPSYVFGIHSKPPKGTTIDFRHITNHSWWSAEKGSHYNKWVTTSRHVDGEHLASTPVHYEYALSSGYNAEPNTSVYGRGTGIFLHVWVGPTTAGCVSVPRSVMQKVFKTLDPDVRRIFAVGTTAKTGATSVYAY